MASPPPPPQNPAPPHAKIPPPAATSQYPSPSGDAAVPTTGALLGYVLAAWATAVPSGEPASVAARATAAPLQDGIDRSHLRPRWAGLASRPAAGLKRLMLPCMQLLPFS